MASNDELTKTDQIKSHLQNQQVALQVIFKRMTNISARRAAADTIICIITPAHLQKQANTNLKEIEMLKKREEQNIIQWNLMMADKEADIATLKEQIKTFNRIVDQRELDVLAESEGSLLELSRDISLTTQQIKVSQLIHKSSRHRPVAKEAKNRCQL